MRARIIARGEWEDVTGRSVESIARTHFGRDATVTAVHSEAFDPPLTEWTVTVPPGHPSVSGRSIVGKIITYNNGPGRPAKPRAGTSDVLVRRMPDALKAELTQAARAAGRSLAEEIIARCTR